MRGKYDIKYDLRKIINSREKKICLNLFIFSKNIPIYHPQESDILISQQYFLISFENITNMYIKSIGRLADEEMFYVFLRKIQTEPYNLFDFCKSFIALNLDQS